MEKKLHLPQLLKNIFFAVWLSQLIAWLLVCYVFVQAGYDTSLGVNSALLINVEMSALYLYQVIKYPEFRGKNLSYQVSWFKMLGTGTISLACILHWPDNVILIGLGIVSWFLDIVYLYLYKNYRLYIQVYNSYV